jgi:hypothetical protein
VADRIRSELGIEVEILRGRLGELSFWVDGRKVARKGWFSSPSDEDYLSAVREAIGKNFPLRAGAESGIIDTR